MDMQWIYVIRMVVPIQPFLCLYALEVEGGGEGSLCDPKTCSLKVEVILTVHSVLSIRTSLL